MHGYKGCVWMASPHGILTNKKFVPPTAVGGFGGVGES